MGKVTNAARAILHCSHGGRWLLLGYRAGLARSEISWVPKPSAIPNLSEWKDFIIILYNVILYRCPSFHLKIQSSLCSLQLLRWRKIR